MFVVARVRACFSRRPLLYIFLCTDGDFRLFRSDHSINYQKAIKNAPSRVQWATAGDQRAARAALFVPIVANPKRVLGTFLSAHGKSKARVRFASVNIDPQVKVHLLSRNPKRALDSREPQAKCALRIEIQGALGGSKARLGIIGVEPLSLDRHLSSERHRERFGEGRHRKGGRVRSA